MTLPTETWHQSVKFVKLLTASNTPLIQFIKECLDTNNTNWEVAGWSGAGVNPAWLIIKRKGVEDNQRLTLFSSAGTPPNTASLDTGQSQSLAYVYAYVTTDRPLTTIDTNPQSGDIFSSTPDANKIKGRAFSTGVPTALNGAISILSTPSTLHLNIQCYGSANCVSVTFGRCVQLTDDADHVALLTSFGSFSNTPAGSSSTWFLPGDYDAGNGPSGGYIAIPSGAKYNIGRVFPTLGANGALFNSTLGGVFYDISIIGRPMGSSVAWEYLGRLRQIRFGPSIVDRSNVYSGATLVAYHSCPPNNGAIGIGLYMDNVA